MGFPPTVNMGFGLNRVNGSGVPNPPAMITTGLSKFDTM